MKSVKFLSAAAVFALAANIALAAGPSVSTVETTKGKVLAGADEMTLYTFRKDSKGTSNCYDDCEKNWPPFFATENNEAHGVYSIIARKDGKKQWAKDGLPLYYWIKDAKKGDITGDGVADAWDLARP